MGRPTLDELRAKVQMLEKIEGLQEALDAAWYAADEMMTVHEPWHEDESAEEFETWKRRRDAISSGLVTLYREAPDRPRRALMSGELATPTPTGEEADDGHD